MARKNNTPFVENVNTTEKNNQEYLKNKFNNDDIDKLNSKVNESKGFLNKANKYVDERNLFTRNDSKTLFETDLNAQEYLNQSNNLIAKSLIKSDSIRMPSCPDCYFPYLNENMEQGGAYKIVDIMNEKIIPELNEQLYSMINDLKDQQSKKNQELDDKIENVLNSLDKSINFLNAKVDLINKELSMEIETVPEIFSNLKLMNESSNRYSNSNNLNSDSNNLNTNSNNLDIKGYSKKLKELHDLITSEDGWYIEAPQQVLQLHYSPSAKILNI